MSDNEENRLEEEKQNDEDPSNPAVDTKYRLAGEIVNKATAHVQSLVKAGARISDVCRAGDEFIEGETAKIFNNKKIEKGIGFPTCISVNHVVGHYSPLPNESASIAEGDFVKIDLGAHIDGFCAVGATTFQAGVEGPSTKKITGKQADVLMAAHFAGEAALRLLRPGRTNTEITEVVGKIASEYGVNPVIGVLSHNMTRFVIDGDKCIIAKSDQDNKVDDCEFTVNEIYAFDIVMSSGNGKPKEVASRTTVFKRNADSAYKLKMHASRQTFSEINKRFPVFPFSMCALQDSKVLLGIKECISRDLLSPYPVLFEKEGEAVAHLKFTALIGANGTVKIAGTPFDLGLIESDKEITDEKIKQLLATSASAKKKKKKKKKK